MNSRLWKSEGKPANTFGRQQEAGQSQCETPSSSKATKGLFSARPDALHRAIPCRTD